MLGPFLLSQIFAFLLVFCRIGTAIMVMPGFSEAYVMARARLLLALFLSFLLAPVVPHMPAPPSTVPALFVTIVSEILTGALIGGLSRMMVSAVHIAGSIIAYQSGLSAALTLGLGQTQGQDTALGNLLSFSAVVLLFITDLHHLMLHGLADSYAVFAPGQLPSTGDFAEHAALTMSSAFRAAMQLAAPSLVVGMIMNLGAGILSRLMPNLQIFFIMIAPQLMVSFLILMVTISAIMMWYLQYFKESLATFMPP